MSNLNWRAMGVITSVLALVFAFLASCEPVAGPGFIVETEPTVDQTPPPDNVVITGDTLRLTDPVEMEFVRVPAGEFLMGSDPTNDPYARDDEFAQHKVTVDDFYIGKYEVTNAQYAAFVGATGHRTPDHWENGEVPSDLEDHPVVDVNWEDAVAFTEWLGEETGRTFRLPTEAEWEKACRGVDGLIYPWGDDFDADKVNTHEADPRATTTVGGYSKAGGDSPYGVTDMAGNVWEWTSTIRESYPYDAGDGRENMEDLQASRVLRGGSFDSFERVARCAFRSNYSPYFRRDDVGFRVGSSPGLSATGLQPSAP